MLWSQHMTEMRLRVVPQQIICEKQYIRMSRKITHSLENHNSNSDVESMDWPTHDKNWGASCVLHGVVTTNLNSNYIVQDQISGPKSEAISSYCVFKFVEFFQCQHFFSSNLNLLWLYWKMLILNIHKHPPCFQFSTTFESCGHRILDTHAQKYMMLDILF